MRRLVFDKYYQRCPVSLNCVTVWPVPWSSSYIIWVMMIDNQVWPPMPASGSTVGWVGWGGGCRLGLSNYHVFADTPSMQMDCSKVFTNYPINWCWFSLIYFPGSWLILKFRAGVTKGGLISPIFLSGQRIITLPTYFWRSTIDRELYSERWCFH